MTGVQASFFSLGWLLGVIVFTLTPAAAAARGTVVSLRAPTMEWEEGRQQVEAELRAAGYVISERLTDAEEPSSVLSELESTRKLIPAPVASVTVLRLGRTGIAYVALGSNPALVRVLGSDAEPRVAAAALALRVFEIVSLAERRREAPAKPSIPPPTEAPPPAPVRHLHLLLGLGAGIPSGAPGAVTELTFGAAVPLPYRLLLEPAVVIGLVPARGEVASGELSTLSHRFGVHLLASVPFGERAALEVGPGAAAQCFFFGGEGEAGVVARDRTACTFFASLRARALVQFRPLSVWLAAEPGLGMPSVRVTSGEEVEAEVARPWLSLSVGGGFEL